MNVFRIWRRKPIKVLVSFHCLLEGGNNAFGHMCLDMPRLTPEFLDVAIGVIKQEAQKQIEGHTIVGEPVIISVTRLESQ